MTRRHIDERFRALADTLPDIVFGTTASGECDYLNRRFYQLTGTAPGTPEASAWHAALHPDDLEDGRRQSHASIERGAPYELTRRLRTADGTYRPFLCRSTPVRNGRGQVVAWLGTCAEVDDRAQRPGAGAQVIAPERSTRLEAGSAPPPKDDFLATLSHELRSPLSTVLNWCQMLRAGGLDPEESAGALETIERNTWLQVRLIDDVLDVARIANGTLALEMQPVDLALVMNAAAETARSAADAKRVTLVVEIDATATTIVGDPTRLQHIVTHLIKNAIRFTPARGRITLGAEIHDGRARLTVADTGIGITPDVLPYVFDRFRQGESALERRPHSLGLGLAIVRHLVEAHGGVVTATSAGDGRGTTVTVELPVGTPTELSAGAASRPPDAHPQPTSPPDLNGVRIVIVDDDPDALELMRTILTGYGAIVATAGSAVEAFDVLQQGRPDVLISDISMPDADGYALLRRVRAPDTGERGMVPAIAVTGYASAGDRQRALAAGYQLHLAKPFDGERLVSAVAQLAGRD